nr:hypothetical protein [uncultured Fluviicola sp.]
MSKYNKDTMYFTKDSSIVQINRGNQSIIVVSDRKNLDKNENANVLVDLLYPIAIVTISSLITFLISRKKAKAENNRLNAELINIKQETENLKISRTQMTAETSKVFAELAKIQEETNQIKRDFQPYVLTTLQETQKELLKSKLEALKTLVNLSKHYYHFEQQYYYGEAIFVDEHDYYQHIYSNFGQSSYSEFQKFIADFEYLFPKSVIEQFSPIKEIIERLYDSNKYSDSLQENMMTEVDQNRIKELSEKFELAIQAIRSDLQLDNSFVHEFVETYKIKK